MYGSIKKHKFLNLTFDTFFAFSKKRLRACKAIRRTISQRRQPTPLRLAGPKAQRCRLSHSVKKKVDSRRNRRLAGLKVLLDNYFFLRLLLESSISLSLNSFAIQFKRDSCAVKPICSPLEFSSVATERESTSFFTPCNTEFERRIRVICDI